jgi:pimeloyl-ACP methyl ester carboxylesterase
MNARLQRLILLLRLCLTLGLAAWLGRRLGLAWGVAVFALGLCASALVMMGLFAPLRRMPQPEGVHSPHWGQVLHAWLREWWVYERNFSWRQPFAAQAVADYLPQAEASSPGVLLLHGFSCNRGLWRDQLLALRRRGVPCMALTLEPAYGSIDAYAPAILAALERLRRHGAGAPVVLAHSMGGLALRAAWRAQGHEPGLLARVITLGTPHHGTRLARWGQTRNARQMRVDSPWLQQLQASEPAWLAQRFVCWYGHCDQIVLPTGQAMLAGADNRHLSGHGHLSLVRAGPVWASLEEALVGAAPV